MSVQTITAHTGSCDTKANSLESLEAAVEVGADIVEFDLRFTGNAKPVMTHNLPATDKCTSVEEAFKYLEDKSILVNIDAKETSNLTGVYELATKYNLANRCFFTGICQGDTAAVKTQVPSMSYYLNYKINPVLKNNTAYIHFLIKKIKACDAVGLNCNYYNLTEKAVKLLHENGLLVSAWTIDDTETAKKFLEMGVDNVTTKNPNEILPLCKRK